ncbi:hypothetical protein AB0N07_01875 [Streptomyces sp. NPDC051172]|uniref:hypothetical protein n=1 Tax=Streptomyces sp. NPDC051172 TaxID=3155796 RepID=UPI003434A46E
MTGARAEVGDLVEDSQGRHAIVTDIKQGKIWVLRPPTGGTTTQWETDAPASLHVLETRASRLSRERITW